MIGAGSARVAGRAVERGLIRVRMGTAQWRDLPSFVILGAQKAGTTSLFRYIMQHPSLRPPIRKEIHYFDLNPGRPLPWYQAHFPFGRQGATGESTPYYLVHPDVPERAARALPATRFIVLLRDPVTRAYSHYQHEVRKGREVLSFRDALEAEEGRIAPFVAGDRDPAATERHQRFSYVTRGLYSEQLDRWFKYVSRDRFQIFFFEEFVREPARIAGEAFAFLGLPGAPVDTQQRFGSHGYSSPLASDDRTLLQERLFSEVQRLEHLLGAPVPWQW